MVNTKIELRNSFATLTGVFIMVLLVMAIFFGSFYYLNANTTSANQTLDSKYSDMRDNLTAYQDQLQEKTDKVKTNVDAMQQSSGLEQVWNGIKGLGSTILLSKEFVSTTIGTYQAIVPGLDFIPFWAYPLIYTGILLFMLFLIIKVAKGEPNM